MARLKKENAKLKAENSKLKKQAAKPPAAKKRHHRHLIRKSLAILLVCIAVAVLTVGNLLFWTGNTIVKQDRFVAATQPIIKDPAVQNTMALYATNSIFSNVDVQGTIENVLPPRADFLAPQLTGQVKSFTQGTFQKVLAKPSFQDKWNSVIAKQHQRLINFASKYQGDGDISLNDIFQNLTTSLSDTKLAFLADKQLPAKVGDIKVISAPWLPAFHNLVTKIDTWRLLAVLVFVLAAAGAIWLSRNRRRTVYVISLASIVMMAVTLIALHVIRDRILGKVDPQYVEGVRHAIQIVFHLLVAQTVTIMAAMVFVGLVAWITGPSRRAVAVRLTTSDLVSGNLHGRIFSQENKVTTWVRDHKHLLEWGVVAIFGAVMLLVRLTLTALVVYIILIILLVLGIEVVSGQQIKPTKKPVKTA